MDNSDFGNKAAAAQNGADVNITVIELNGFRDVSKDHAKLFFESRRSSGGGEIVEFTWDELNGRAIIQYENEESKWQRMLEKLVYFTQKTCSSHNRT